MYPISVYVLLYFFNWHFQWLIHYIFWKKKCSKIFFWKSFLLILRSIVWCIIIIFISCRVFQFFFLKRSISLLEKYKEYFWRNLFLFWKNIIFFLKKLVFLLEKDEIYIFLKKLVFLLEKNIYIYFIFKENSFSFVFVFKENNFS